MNNNFTSDSILYYPTIEFQSETWVKSAITFWDKIYRIVPPHYQSKDSDEVKIAISEGIIENIELSDNDLKTTADNFEAFCNTLDWFPDGFETSQFSVRLHTDKIDSRLKPYFNEFAGQIDNEGFYSLRPEIANGYMFFLSDSISKNRNIGKLTDNPDMFTAMTYFDAKGNFDELLTNSESEELYSNLMIENLIPADIRSIRMDKVIRLGDDLKNYKAEFRDSVAIFADQLSKIEDQKFAVKEIKKFQDLLMNQQLTRKELLSGFSKNLIPSVLYVGIPTLTASLIGSVFTSKDDVFGLVELFKGTLIAGVASVANAGKETRNSWDSKKSNYYLDLRKDLVSKENSEIRIWDMNYKLNEYVND
jgi:hypothetical protein